MHTGFQKDQGVGEIVNEAAGVFGSQARESKGCVSATNAQAMTAPSTCAFRPADRARPIFTIMNQ
jgi:hypothetical protein